jgi:hypothetical protein
MPNVEISSAASFAAFLDSDPGGMPALSHYRLACPVNLA